MNGPREVQVPCPVCRRPITAPITTRPSPVHRIGEVMLILDMDTDPIRQHIATHGGSPGPGESLPIAV